MRSDERKGGGARAHAEPLERRTLLSTWAPNDLTIRVYHDKDGDGVRDRGEGGVAGLDVELRHRDAQGRSATSTARTSAAGEARFTVYSYRLVDDGVRFTVSDPARAYRTQPTSGSVYQLRTARTTLQAWASDHGTISGQVRYRFESAFGGERLHSLMGARVFADYDRDGVRDRNEPHATTDELGAYAMRARYGRVPVRVEPRAGWRRAGGKADALMVSHVARADGQTHVPALFTQMVKPVVIDVLAVMAGATVGTPDAFDHANHVFANSDAGVFLRLVESRFATLSINGTSPGDVKQALARLSNPGDGVADEVPPLRDALGADLVVGFAYVAARPRDTRVGLAYQFDDDSRGGEFGYAVVAPKVGYPDPTDVGKILAHEVGHSLGAGHDVDANDGATPGDADQGPAYAHGYRLPQAGGRTGDVMSYNVEHVLPVFSNPKLNWQGRPLGVNGSADNVRRIREVAPVVSAYRRESATPPTRGMVLQRAAVFPPGRQREWHGPFADLPISL